MKRLFTARKVNLATLLSLLVSTSVIFTLMILTISTYHSNKESLITTYLTQNFSKAEKMSHSVESLFVAMRTNLESTVDFLEAHEEMSDQEIQEQLELLRISSGYFSSFSWVDETGLVRVISPISIGLKGERITSGITKEVLDAEEPALTPPYIGPSNRLLILMTQPIYSEDGTYRGMVGGTIYLQEPNVLNDLLGNDEIEQNGSHYFVVGPQGTMLYHPENRLIGEDASENVLVRKLTQGKSGMELVPSNIGIPMLAAYSYVPEADWGIVQQTPYSFVEGLLADQIQDLLINILVPFLLLLLLSIFIARKLAEPFIRLGNLVNRLAEGKTVAEPLKEALMEPHWNREAHLLTKSVSIAFETLERNNQQLSQSASTDSLTGLQNRRKMDEVLNAWSREHRLFSLLVLDIDHFKSINDTYGHQTGDETLKKLAETIQKVARNNDHCFRYGGEEFVLLLADTDMPGAYNLAEKIRGKVEQTNLIPGRTITVSIGLSEFPKHTKSADELFKLADKALYESKFEGRNRTTVYSN